MDIVAKVKAFHQLKADLRCGKPFLIVGVDAGKASSKACFCTFTNDVLIRKFHIPHTLDGFHLLIETIERLKKAHGLQEAIIGFEPTGTYHKILGEYLQQRGYCVAYVSSVAVKNNRRTLAAGRWGKNDPRDAYNVVDLMRQGKIQFYRDSKNNALEMRGYLSIHRRLTKNKTALKTRVRNNIWACYFPEADTIFANADDPDALYLLEHFCSAEALRLVDRTSFLKHFSIGARQHSRFDRLISIWEAAQTSVGCSAPPSIAFEAQIIARDIRQILDDLKRIEKQLAIFCSERDSFQQLQTIPGFGNFVTAVFKACIGDINAFDHPRQLTRLAGIDVESMTSGTYAGRERISKKGIALLRYAVCQAVSVAVSRTKDMKALFEQRLSAQGGTKQARAKLKIKFADKLLRTVFYILKNDVPFDFKRFNVPVDDPAFDYVRA